MWVQGSTPTPIILDQNKGAEKMIFFDSAVDPPLPLPLMERSPLSQDLGPTPQQWRIKGHHVKYASLGPKWKRFSWNQKELPSRPPCFDLRSGQVEDRGILHQRPLDSRTRTTTRTRCDLKFFPVFLKKQTPWKASLHFFCTLLSVLTEVKPSSDRKIIKF